MGAVSEQFPESRQQAIGLISSVFPIGLVIGPNLGGWLVEVYGWASVFWINIPLGAIVFAVLIFLLKPGKRESGHIDLTGAGLLTCSLAALLFALGEIDHVREGASWDQVSAVPVHRRVTRCKLVPLDLFLSLGVLLMLLNHIGRSHRFVHWAAEV